MLLISDAGGFWGTEWDDQPIRPENFREWKKEKTEPQKKSEKTGIEKAGAEEQKNQKEADKIMTVEEVQEEEEGISASMMNQESKKVPQEDRIVPEENKLEMSEAGPPHPGPGPRPPEPPHPGPRPPRPPRPVPGIPYDPFNDGQFTDCRKIKPSDCSTLCRKNGCFCNNRFVMYGYQNFGHLLLCQNYRGQYILGVPGSYSQQERFMANMFGFPISEKALKFIFREEKADTGIVLSMSEQNNSPELQIHTTNFNYRDCPRKDIPVVFHFIL